MTHFDHEHAARKAGFSPEESAQLSRAVRAEFPHGDMLYELHMLRACRAVREGMLTIADVIHDDSLTGGR